jgi:hypothetical protein
MGKIGQSSICDLLLLSRQKGSEAISMEKLLTLYLQPHWLMGPQLHLMLQVKNGTKMKQQPRTHFCKRFQTLSQ